MLCEPIRFNGKVFGGYAKRCPCCGARVHTELTGFRIAKLRQVYPINNRNENVLIDIACCQNCFDAFSYASEYDINVERFITDNEIEISVSLAGETWKPEVFRPRIAHAALIFSMNPDLEGLIEK